MPVGSPGAILEGVEAALLEAVEELVPCNSGDAELAAQRGHLLALEEPGYESEAFIHRLTLFPGHLWRSPNAERCKPCPRNGV